MNNKYILTHDLGTSGNKTALYDFKLNLIAQAKTDYPIYYPKPGWAEQDASDYWNSVIKNTKKLLQETGISPDNIQGMIFDTQGNCTIPIDEHGNPLMRSINWLDTRAGPLIQKAFRGVIKISGYGARRLLRHLKITGGAPSSTGKDPISHILWIKKNKPEIYDKTYKFLNVKDFVIFKCTKKAIVSRCLGHSSWLMDTNPEVFDWSDKLLKKFKIDRNKLPEIKKSTEVAGNLTPEAAQELGIKPKIPVFVGSVDWMAASIGSGAIDENQIHINIGTAAWVAAHVYHRKKDIFHYVGPVSTEDNYLCISKQETGAACLDWIKEQMFKDEISKYGENSNEIYDKLTEIALKSEPGASNLLFGPWMFGERSPINDPNARGGFFNLFIAHDRSDMLRSVLEGVAYNLKWSLQFVEKLSAKNETINFIGGGAKSDFWCQIIADVLDRNINQMEDPSLGSTKGSAIVALVGLGVLNNLSEAIPLVKVEKTYKPNPENREIYDKLFAEFIKLYKNQKKMLKTLNA